MTTTIQNQRNKKLCPEWRRISRYENFESQLILYHHTWWSGGTISAYADELLEADIKGGGSISYKGNPKALSNISGRDSVKQD